MDLDEFLDDILEENDRILDCNLREMKVLDFYGEQNEGYSIDIILSELGVKG